MAVSAGSSAARRPATSAGAPPNRRPPLRLFEPAPRHRRVRRRPTVVVAIGLITFSLLSVVVADDMVAQSQVGLTTTQLRLAAAETAQKQLQASVAEQSAPQVVVTEAQGLGMVAAPKVVDLPYVPLTVALPAPRTAPGS